MIGQALIGDVGEIPARRSRARPISVCQLLHTLHVGGAEVLAARLARKLRSQCRFHFVCLDDLGTLGEQLRGEGFPVTVLGRRAGLDGGCAWRLARILRRERIDIIHAHQYTPFFYSMIARLLHRRPPVLFTEHGRHFPDFPRRKRMVANRLLLERRDRVVGVGDAVRRALIVNEGIPEGRVGVIYNGIDTRRFAGGVERRDVVRREIGVEPDDFVLLTVARLDYLKDHGTAVRCLQRVVREIPAAKLVLVGTGPELQKIQAQVRQADLEAHVRLLGLRQDIERLLPAADLFLLTSISEGIPLTVIEAMAAGLPVVATRVGGMAEVVEDGVTGCLAASGDDAALAAQVVHLARSPHACAMMGGRGQERARVLFSEEQMHARYFDLYREMLRA